jgi:hypothetical protein
MVGNRKASVRRHGVSKYHVASVLDVEFVPGLSECADCIAAGHDRQFRLLVTSTTSSRMLGGKGSPCF